MDIDGGRRRKKIKVMSNDLASLYPLDVQMYTNPPTNEVSLSEFEDLALDRYNLLRALERASQKGHKPFSLEWKECTRIDLKQENLTSYLRLIRSDNLSTEADYQARRADHLSHYILRLAYCRSEDLRRWFLNREQEFLKLRFMDMAPEHVRTFLQLNNLNYTPISAEEKRSIMNELVESTVGFPDSKIEIMDFYKVRFTDVLGLIKSRRVYLSKGFAYIPSSELITCILTKFRAYLSEELVKLNKRLPSIDDDRIDELLTNIHSSYTGQTYNHLDSEKNEIDVGQMDVYSKQNFPLCMRSMQEHLKTTHHLKHGCRMHFGLFLKGIGVTYEDAMRYFRDEFCKKIDQSNFEKNYSYNIKHLYGKVGRMVSYSPYSCMKIINTSVGPGDNHGCPFRHWDGSVIRQKLIEYGFNAEAINEIVSLSTKGHFQIACGKYFQTIHGQESKEAITHPNQYFEESLATMKK